MLCTVSKVKFNTLTAKNPVTGLWCTEKVQTVIQTTIKKSDKSDYNPQKQLVKAHKKEKKSM